MNSSVMLDVAMMAQAKTRSKASDPHHLANATSFPD